MVTDWSAVSVYVKVAKCSLIEPLHTLLWDLYLGETECIRSEIAHS